MLARACAMMSFLLNETNERAAVGPRQNLADDDAVDTPKSVRRHRGQQSARGLRVEQQRQLGMARAVIHAVDQVTRAQVLRLQRAGKALGEQLDGAFERGQGVETQIDRNLVAATAGTDHPGKMASNTEARH